MNSFSLHISKTVFLSSLFLNIFDKFWFLNWCVFPLIKIFSGLCCFWSEVCCHSYLYTFVGKLSFISASTYDFIFIAGLSSLIMLYCSVLWCGFLHGFCPPVSLNFFRYVCVCEFLVFIRFGSFSAIISSGFLSAPPLLLHWWLRSPIYLNLFR